MSFGTAQNDMVAERSGCCVDPARTPCAPRRFPTFPQLRAVRWRSAMEIWETVRHGTASMSARSQPGTAHTPRQRTRVHSAQIPPRYRATPNPMRIARVRVDSGGYRRHPRHGNPPNTADQSFPPSQAADPPRAREAAPARAPTAPCSLSPAMEPTGIDAAAPAQALMRSWHRFSPPPPLVPLDAPAPQWDNPTVSVINTTGGLP